MNDNDPHSFPLDVSIDIALLALPEKYGPTKLQLMCIKLNACQRKIIPVYYVRLLL